MKNLAKKEHLEQSNLPMEINIDTVRQLKWSDRDAANDLIKAMKKNRETNKAMEYSKFGKIERMKRRVRGICTTLDCKNKPEKGKARCEKCNEYHRKFYREMKKK